MTIEHVKAWQCIGCGKIEELRTCVGVCQDRRVEFVYASEHREELAQAESRCRQADTLEALVRQLASTTPHTGEWERSFRALQDRARQILATIARDQPAV